MNSTRRHILTPAGNLAMASCCALALAACGSSAKPGAEKASDAQAIVYADCMRAHGVSNYPDTSAVGVQVLKKVMEKTPAFVSASAVCAASAPVGTPQQQISESEKTALVAAAKCMRAHGAPGVPDPTFGPDGASLGDSGIGTQAPAFKRAAARCHYPVPQ